MSCENGWLDIRIHMLWMRLWKSSLNSELWCGYCILAILQKAIRGMKWEDACKYLHSVPKTYKLFNKYHTLLISFPKVSCWWINSLLIDEVSIEAEVFKFLISPSSPFFTRKFRKSLMKTSLFSRLSIFSQPLTHWHSGQTKLLANTLFCSSRIHSVLGNSSCLLNSYHPWRPSSGGKWMNLTNPQAVRTFYPFISTTCSLSLCLVTIIWFI